MNLQKVNEHKKSKEYKMLLILKCFKRALKISDDYIGSMLYITSSRISKYEKGNIRIPIDILEQYSNLIASKMGFDKIVLYSILEKYAEEMVVINQYNIMNAFSQIILFMEELK